MRGMDNIKYCSDGILFAADYEDITTYHGGRYPAGTILGYKAMSLASGLLFPEGGAFERGSCSVETSFTGTGFMDAIEMVLRCRSLGLYSANPEMPVPEGTPPAPVRGSCFFKFAQKDGEVELILRPGLIPDEFYRATEDLSSGRIHSEDEVLRLRRDIEAALLPVHPSEIFDVHRVRPCSADLAERMAPPPIEDDFTVRILDYGEFKADVERTRRYHGDDSLCGLCLTWSLIKQWVTAKPIFRENPVHRMKLAVKSGAFGRGIDDALEFLFRTSGSPRLSVDTGWGADMGVPDALEVLPGAGFFVFGLSYGGSHQDIFTLREDLVPREYLDLCRLKSEHLGDFREMPALKSLQRDFANRVLSEPEPFAFQPG
jgi:hypothetical protein